MDTRLRAGTVVDAPARLATVDIVIPVYNEERALPGCVRTLTAFLDDSFPMPWRITIVDNGSTDATWQIAQALASGHSRVHARRLEIAGRGAALKAAWRDSPADIVAYMDVDLSTGLGALFPMVASLASGHSEIAIGTRLAHTARTRRSVKREVISRGYNTLLRVGFGARFSDAQCGFKAARADVIRPLMDRVEDDAWFFDTELLLLAEHNGLRVHEVPVDWVEDLDSRVRVVRTAVADLKGLARLTWSMSTGRATVDVAGPAELAPVHPDAVVAEPKVAKLVKFAAVGAFTSVLYALLYLPLREVLEPALCNLAALVLTGVVNTEANRRWTFGRRGGKRTGMHLRAAAVFLSNYAVTTAVVVGLAPAAGRLFEVAAVVATYGVLTLLRFIALDRWVFARTRS
ncbi:glycosyltransferase [Nonomuraea sp. NPDC049725]|uniref:glycosyltransferase n=1 Tax=Nonomuraea sp. NPDC049725 TaxID=3154508 RepID=UPI00342C6617